MYNYLKKNRIKALLIPLVLYWLLLFIGTTLPADHFSDILEISDKIKHFTAYLGLAVLLALNLHFQEKWKFVALNYLIYTFIICSTYGILDEVHQIFVPNRSAEFLDWLADLFGTIVGIGLTYFLLSLLRKNSNKYETN